MPIPHQSIHVAKRKYNGAPRSSNPKLIRHGKSLSTSTSHGSVYSPSRAGSPNTTASSPGVQSLGAWSYPDHHHLPDWSPTLTVNDTLLDDADAGPSLFACPYAKYDAVKYSISNINEPAYRSCGKCILTSISRLKQHVYRVHAQPVHYCPTCFKEFESQDAALYHVGTHSCSPQPCPFLDKMTPEQMAKVKRKQRNPDANAYWNEIYQILFPGATLPNTPYPSFKEAPALSSATVSTVLNQFTEYIQQNMPVYLSQQLGQGLFPNPALQMRFQASLQLSMVGIMRDLRREFDSILQQSGSDSFTQVPPVDPMVYTEDSFVDAFGMDLMHPLSSTPHTSPVGPSPATYSEFVERPAYAPQVMVSPPPPEVPGVEVMQNIEFGLQAATAATLQVMTAGVQMQDLKNQPEHYFTMQHADAAPQ